MAYRSTSGRPGSTQKMAMSSLMERNPKPAEDVADEMLKNIGQQVLALLGKGGQKVRQFDDKYAAFVRDQMMPKNPDGSIMSVARSGMGAVIGSPVTHGLADVSSDPRMINQVAKYAIPAASIGARYVLPALALKAVADLTGDVYDAASDIPVF